MEKIDANLKFQGKLSTRTQTSKGIIHHSASGPATTALQVHQWHLNNGWAGNGYNYHIRGNGLIEICRPENIVGAHTKGHNHDSIGICLAGDFTEVPPTKEQITSLVWLIKDIRTRYPDLPFGGHSDYDRTLCPGHLFPWETLLNKLNNKVQLKVEPNKTIVHGMEIESYLINGITYVPIRDYTSLLMSYVITWDDKNRTAIVRRGFDEDKP